MLKLKQALLIAGFVCIAAPGLIAATTDARAQTSIAVAVNNGVVTTNQITQRARFLRLTGFKGDTVEAARKQLINEELQFQEGKRIGFSVSDAQVQKSLARVASSNGATVAQFTGGLTQRGINVSTFKRLIKARLLWQQIVVARERAERRKASEDKRDITSILFNRGSDGKNRKVKEYTVNQFIFVLNNAASEKQASQRQKEASAFKSTNKSCKEAEAAALRLAADGVVMKRIGRFTTDTLPPEMKEDILAINNELFTTPRRGEKGIGMLAICKTREIVDNTPSQNVDFNVGRLNNKELEDKSKAWMAEIKDRSQIVIR